MSVRLQVLLPESEMDEIRRLARRERLSIAEWVRRTLRDARLNQSFHDTQQKLRAVREASKYAFPTADIDQMLSEIERGCLRRVREI